MNTNANVPIDMCCPISLEIFNDPISLPCCGQAISRQSIIDCMSNSLLCPLCKKSLNKFNAYTCPKSVNIAYLIENYKKSLQDSTQMNKKSLENNDWNGIIKIVPTDMHNIYSTVIGQLILKTSNVKQLYKTLLIPVIDKSGSMSGNPTSQVKYSMNRLLDITYKHNNILTNIITYNDRATTMQVDTSNQQTMYTTMVDNMSAGGGTSFTCAFDEIIKRLDTYKNDNNISSLVVVFLTDGEDSSVSRYDRLSLVQKLKSNIANIWTKPYIVHSIGFGSSHDFDFLNNLRQIGSSEGSYRYADPSEDSDNLSSKINGILNVIAVSSSIPIEVLATNQSIPILSICNENDKTKYWINLTNKNQNESYMYQIKIGTDVFDVIVPISQCDSVDEEEKIKNDWYSHLIDNIASELLQLSNFAEMTIDKEIHLELLTNRSRSILMRVSTEEQKTRLTKLSENINLMKSGGKLDKLKLTDMKFEGKYITEKKGDYIKQGSVYRPSYYNPNQLALPSISTNLGRKCWNTIEITKEMKYSRTSDFIFDVIENWNNENAINWLNQNIKNIDTVDNNGSNILIVASYMGRCKIVEHIAKIKQFFVNETNNYNYSSLDMAVLRGYWKSCEILLNFGAKLSIDGNLLLRTLISNRHFITASLLVKQNFVVVTPDMHSNVPTNEGLQWLSKISEKNIDPETAFLKGIFDVVENNIKNMKPFSLEKFIEIFEQPSDNHVKIVKLLCENNLIDPNQIITKEENKETLLLTSFFLTCEKGNKSMFNVLKKYTKQFVNFQNERGTTCLWIACCNKHIDMVMELLEMGADPNICNFKGDGPLIPCIQKGHATLVELLLESGASIKDFNKNRDGPVLIACRTGQASILETLLKSVNQETVQELLNTYAEIDGFVPLLAATELDKTSCIRTCHKFGANLETKTENNNAVIAGATSIHLACHYGRLSSLQTLCSLGADMGAVTNVSGQNILHIAIKQGHSECVRYILMSSCGKQLMNVSDNDGKLPMYYAKMTGNEAIFNEFFVDRLAIKLESALYTSSEVESKCANVLTNYSQSLGAYEYSDLMKIDMGSNMSLLTHALLNNNKSLIENIIKFSPESLHTKDDYGLSPAFWANILGYQLCELDEPSKQCIDRVKKYSLQGLQNKLLLNIKPGKPALLQLKDYNNQLEKMNDGYESKVINDLTVFESSEQSILGFLDKLKNAKYFADGKDCLDNLLWNSKINLIKIIASEEYNDALQPLHIMALYLYTSNFTIFQSVNRTLIDWKNNQVFHGFIQCLYQAIKTLEPCDATEVYRGVNTCFDIEMYKIGTIMQWNTFSICSREYSTTTELITQNKGIIFVIKSKVAKDVSKFSKNKQNCEVVFLPGTRFIITNHYIASNICLSQRNIRNTTFGINNKNKDAYYTKVMKNEASIIIELEDA